MEELKLFRFRKTVFLSEKTGGGAPKASPQGEAFLYKENHALDAWFKKAYGGEKTPCRGKENSRKKYAVG